MYASKETKMASSPPISLNAARRDWAELAATTNVSHLDVEQALLGVYGGQAFLVWPAASENGNGTTCRLLLLDDGTVRVCSPSTYHAGSIFEAGLVLMDPTITAQAA